MRRQGRGALCHLAALLPLVPDPSHLLLLAHLLLWLRPPLTAAVQPASLDLVARHPVLRWHCRSSHPRPAALIVTGFKMNCLGPGCGDPAGQAMHSASMCALAPALGPGVTCFSRGAHIMGSMQLCSSP